MNITIELCQGNRQCPPTSEGCFSVPGSIENPRRVLRIYKIKVTFNNEAGETIKKTYKGFEARLIQHDIDHLSGVLI